MVALVWFSTTAYYNVGYYHPDEHYQIIEFAQALKGEAPGDGLSGVINGKSGNGLAWELHERVRPALQPVIGYVIFKTCDLLSLTDHFTQALILRLLTGLLAVWIIYLFAGSCKRFIPHRYWEFFLIVSYFLWFVPLINVRFSSETWSGLCLMLSVMVALKETKGNRDFLILGILGGISFLFRFQSAFATAGLFMWLFMIQRIKFSYSVPYIIGLLILLISGTGLDSWAYGEFTITPWRYFKVNIFDDIASSFGTSPWYYYFYFIFRFSFFPFGIVIIGSFLILAIKRPTNIFIWIIVPFVILHSIIPHKEVRFLFPIMNFIPVMIVLALAEIDKRYQLFTKTYFKAMVSAFIAINMAALITSNFKPADRGRISMAETIHEMAKGRQVNLYHTPESNPYDPFTGLTATFYTEPVMTFNDIHSCPVNVPQDGKAMEDVIIVMTKDLDDPEVRRLIDKCHFKKASQSIPEFFIPLLKLYGGYKVDEVLVLYVRE